MTHSAKLDFNCRIQLNFLLTLPINIYIYLLIYIYIYIYKTYKFELFLVIQKKKAHKYKIIKKLCILCFTYIGFIVFYVKLTHL